ncbi:MAG: AAA family ATPase [Desulfococcaceae bacterium]
MIQTRWHVITGAPCSGKTAVIQDLEARGYRVVHETARRFLEKEREKLKLESPEYRKQAQAAILDIKLEIESALPADETLFLDRGVPDSIAYYLLHGLDPAEIMERGRRHRYRRVFFCKRLPLQADFIRTEDEATVARLHAFLLQAYRRLDYTVIPVPVLSIGERADFILKHL